MLEAIIEYLYHCKSQSISLSDVVDFFDNELLELKNNRGVIKSRIFNEKDVSKRIKNTFKNFAELPNDTKECVYSTISNCLSVFHQEPLNSLMNSNEDNSVDLSQIITEGKCVVVSCASRSYGSATLPLLLAVKEAFSDLVLCRHEIEIKNGESWDLINNKREIIYVADECHKVLNNGEHGGELDFLDLSREYGCRAILATQSYASLAGVMGPIAAERLSSLCANQYFLTNIDHSTVEHASRLFADGSDLPPVCFGTAPVRNVRWTGPDGLGRLKKGEYLLRTNLGTYRKKVKLVK